MATSLSTASIKRSSSGLPKCPNTFFESIMLGSSVPVQLERGVCGFYLGFFSPTDWPSDKTPWWSQLYQRSTCDDSLSSVSQHKIKDMSIAPHMHMSGRLRGYQCWKTFVLAPLIGCPICCIPYTHGLVQFQTLLDFEEQVHKILALHYSLCNIPEDYWTLIFLEITGNTLLN